METLVWDTRLRLEGGVEVAGSGMGLLNGQATKGDPIALEEGVGVAYSKQSRS
jgi:hypothetical protein